MRPIANMMEAPTCTVGPSRPIEAPHNSPSRVRRILPTAMRMETSLPRAAWSLSWRAAMACGMPLPCEFWKYRLVINTDSMKPAGVTNSDA